MINLGGPSPSALNTTAEQGNSTQLPPVGHTSFAPEVFEHFAPRAPSADSIPGKEDAPRAGVHYRAAIHGDHSAFRLSPDYHQYRVELYSEVEFLCEFCRRQSMPDADKIALRFKEFYHHRFPQSFLGDQHLYRFMNDNEDMLPFFEGYEYLIDGQGKETLDHICDMIRDPRIPIEKKTAAIRNLSMGIDVCATGAVSSLISAEAELAISSDGIRTAVWRVKQRIAEDAVRQEAFEKYSNWQRYKQNEIHIVNAGWNQIAGTIGLTPRIDPFAAKYYGSIAFETSREKFSHAMTPDQVARIIADEIQGIFSSRFAEQGWTLSGDCSDGVNQVFENILCSIRQQYQLAPEDLRLSSFIRLDDGGTRYRVRSDVSLIARDLLRVMRAENLLTEDSLPVDQGQWTDSDGTRHALLTFGSALAWCADQPGAPSDTSAWSLDTDAEQLTMPDLHAWWEARGSGREVFSSVFPPAALSAALRQAVDGAVPADIDNIPSRWLTDVENLFIVLPHMTNDAVQRCLHATLPYFIEPLSDEVCARLIDVAMGKSTDVLELARSRYPNPWKLLSEPRDKRGDTRLQYWMATDNGVAIDAWRQTAIDNPDSDTGTQGRDQDVFETLRGLKSKPALNVAMTAGNANAAAAWCRLASAPGVIDRLGKRLVELLEAKDADGCTALGRALDNGRAQALEAFHDLLANPATAERIGSALHRVLKAHLKAGAPGLLRAMQNGHACSVQVFHAMLVAPTVLPRIESALPDLVRARAPRTGIPGLTSRARTTGFVQAMKYGYADVIRAFHVMVVHPRILPKIAKSLPTMMTDKGPDGTGFLAMALEYGRAGAIRMFSDMVADPLIRPHVEKVLDEVVLAQTPHGRTGLGLALENGRADAIEALHAFMVNSAIRPSITRCIPKVLAARQRGGTPGLSLALRNNQAPAVDAYADMLADPVLLPFIQHDLSRLIQDVLVNLAGVLDASSTSKALPAMRENQGAALTAFRRMVRRPEIAAHLDENTLEKLKVLEAEETSATTATTLTPTHTIPERGAAVMVATPRPGMGKVIDRIIQRFV